MHLSMCNAPPLMYGTIYLGIPSWQPMINIVLVITSKSSAFPPIYSTSLPAQFLAKSFVHEMDHCFDLSVSHGLCPFVCSAALFMLCIAHAHALTLNPHMVQNPAPWGWWLYSLKALKIPTCAPPFPPYWRRGDILVKRL